VSAVAPLRSRVPSQRSSHAERVDGFDARPVAAQNLDMDDVALVRSFNRIVTRRIGVLKVGYLGRGRSLAACRVLYEIGRESIALEALRERLSLDAADVRELLRSLQVEKLVVVSAGNAAGRVRRVRLTAAGRRELALIERLSDEAAAELLDPLSGREREALLAAMAAVEKLLLASAVRIEVVPPSGALARECLSRYFGELETRFEEGYDRRYGLSLAQTLSPPAGYFAVALLDGRPIACGGLRCHEDHGEIQRMWVAPERRRLGVARRLLEYLEGLARARGLPRIRLSTNRSLTEARSLYPRSGYREVAAFDSERYAHHWFEKVL
jgi:ribosomal protein S18 acetylase RimI-like enzyme